MWWAIIARTRYTATNHASIHRSAAPTRPWIALDVTSAPLRHAARKPTAKPAAPPTALIGSTTASTPVFWSTAGRCCSGRLDMPQVLLRQDPLGDDPRIGDPEATVELAARAEEGEGDVVAARQAVKAAGEAGLVQLRDDQAVGAGR